MANSKVLGILLLLLIITQINASDEDTCKDKKIELLSAKIDNQTEEINFINHEIKSLVAENKETRDAILQTLSMILDHLQTPNSTSEEPTTVSGMQNITTEEPTTIGDAKCPDRWVSRGNFCYLHAKEWVPWNKADELCQKYGGHLASIHDQDENDFIFNLGKGSDWNAWIGARGSSSSGVWNWSDKTGFKYTNWVEGLPNEETEACVWMYEDEGNWSDIDCGEENHFVCKLKLGEA